MFASASSKNSAALLFPIENRGESSGKGAEKETGRERTASKRVKERNMDSERVVKTSIKKHKRGRRRREERQERRENCYRSDGARDSRRAAPWSYSQTVTARRRFIHSQ